MHISQANQRNAPSHSQHQNPAELLAPLPTYAHQGSLLLSSTTCFLRVELELASTPPQFSNVRVYATHREDLHTERVSVWKGFMHGKCSHSESVYTQKRSTQKRSTHGEGYTWGARILGDPTFNLQPWIRPPCLSEIKQVVRSKKKQISWWR